MKFLYTLILSASILLSFGQIKMPEYDLNKNYPGAVYKFSFVHISDVHIGEDVPDFGTPGFFDDTAASLKDDTSHPVVRLKKAVQWINEHEVDKNIKFVVLSGDLTGSAEKSEFTVCKNIMDGLHMPYVPIIGNHDIWPYIRYQWEAPYANGDSLMGDVFAETYDHDKLFFDNWNDGERLTRTYDPEDSIEHYLQNFSFEYQGFIFYGLDFNPRYHCSTPAPGIGPEAQLMDWPGGTYRWLKNELETNPRQKNHNVCFISHHPATENIFFILSGFVFDNDEYYKLVDMLKPHQQNLGLWMAGHIHIDYDYALVNNVMRIRGTAANKDYDSAHFEIINVYEVPNLTGVKEITDNKQLNLFPNPNGGKFTVAEELYDPETILRMYDAVGTKIYEKPMKDNLANGYYQFDFSFLPKGSYYLEVATKDNTYSKRFVIQ